MLDTQDLSLKQDSFRYDLKLITAEEYIKILEKKVKKLENKLG